jgi:hypothetical protein
MNVESRTESSAPELRLLLLLHLPLDFIEPT